MMQMNPFGYAAPPTVTMPADTMPPAAPPTTKTTELRYTITTTNDGTTIALENDSGSITLTPRELAEIMGKAGKHF